MFFFAAWERGRLGGPEPGPGEPGGGAVEGGRLPPMGGGGPPVPGRPTGGGGVEPRRFK